MVKVDDTVSYGVDFFRVKGGDDHIYSFHSQADEIGETQGLAAYKAGQGDVCGPPCGVGPPRRHRLQLAVQCQQGEKCVRFQRRFSDQGFPQCGGEPGKSASAYDYAAHIAPAGGSDCRRQSSGSQGQPLERLKYVLARAQGKDLDTLFTTVLEPYQGKRSIKSIQAVPAEAVEGAPADTDLVRAVRDGTLENGRVDYIVHATNNAVLYRVDGVFDFRGAFGVYSMQSGKAQLQYVNDGDRIGELKQATGAYTGTVADFTRSLSLENTVTVAFDKAPEDVGALAGRYLYVENDGEQNAVYKIQGAHAGQEGQVVLELGSTTLIRKYIDSSKLDQGFVCNMAGEEFPHPVGKSIICIQTARCKFVCSAPQP